jgi:hypothetical protein
MPQDAITMYNKDGTKQIQVQGSAAFKAAQAKGWSKDKPINPTPQAAQPKPDQGQGKPGDNPLTNVGFGGGFARGINPFHTPADPANLPSFSNISQNKGQQPGMMDKVSDTVADSLNIREAAGMMHAGNVKGGLGMEAGTMASMFGSEALKLGGKAMKGVEPLANTALDMAGKREAAQKAFQLVKTIKGNIKDARIAETLVQPIRNVLNAKFEPMHKALENEAVQFTNKAKSLITAIARNNPEAAKEISELFRETGRTTTSTTAAADKLRSVQKVGQGTITVPSGAQVAGKMKRISEAGSATRDVTKDTRYAVRPNYDYRSADRMVSRLRSMQGEHPILGKLADEIDKGLDDVAKAKGLLQDRIQLKGWYKQLKDIEVAATTSVTHSALRQMAKAVPKLGKFVSSGEGKVGEEEVKAANDLMREIQGKVKNEAIAKIGQIAEKAGKTWQRVPPAYKAILSGFSQGPMI